MQLPTELRLKVFRSLLKSDKPLKPLDDFEFYKPQKSTPLSAQLLRSCQKVYAECLPILYQENTLVVQFLKVGCLQMLGICLKVAECLHLYEKYSMPMHLLEYVTKVSTSPPYKVYPEDHTHAQYIVQIYPVLKRFRKFEARVEVHARSALEWCFITCRMLQDLLFDKEVIFIGPHTAEGFTAGQHRSAISACRYLRCRSITFPDCEVSTTDLTKTITSTNAVTDTYLILQELRRQEQHLPRGFLPNYVRNLRSFKALTNAVMRYDLERTQEEIKVDLSVWIVWCGDWARLEKKNVHVNGSNIDTHRDRAIEKLRSAFNNGTIPHLEELGECPGGE